MTHASSGEDQEAAKLVAYVRSLGSVNERPPWNRASAQCEHIGAKLADATLQRGVNYEHGVRARVEKVAAYPEATTTGGLLRLLKERGPKTLLGIASGPKPATFQGLAEALDNERVDSVEELRSFLRDRWMANRLRRVPGVGPKTIAFLKLVCGLDAVAVDRHVLAALRKAGIAPCDPSEAAQLFARAAKEMGKPMADMDALLWRKRPSITATISVRATSRRRARTR
jgi:hypothetical protein